MATPAWIHKLTASIDAMDADTFVSFLTEDAQFRYGSNPPTVGRGAIRDGVAMFFTQFKKLRHSLTGTWTHPDVVFMQGDVTYTRLDGSDVTVPFVNCLKMRGDKVHEYLIYIDPSPMAA